MRGGREDRPTQSARANAVFLPASLGNKYVTLRPCRRSTACQLNGSCSFSDTDDWQSASEIIRT
jgi:hypothetical protein